MDTHQILQVIKAEISRLQRVVDLLEGSSRKVATTAKPRRKISAAGRKRIAAAQRARWAKVKASKKKG